MFWQSVSWSSHIKFVQAVDDAGTRSDTVVVFLEEKIQSQHWEAGRNQKSRF